ncbi:MAG: ATP-binding cassette domain-containing protein [bacterium]
MHKDIVIQASSILKEFKEVTALDHIDFTVYRGECFGMLGPNGAGKTTMMKMLYNFTVKNGGSLKVFDLDPAINSVGIKFRTGVVPQEDNLDPELTAQENLEIFSRYYGLSKTYISERINQLFKFMNLENKKKNKIKELSGGMQRRLVIMRALINKPELLLLDEPTTGLDPAARHLIWDRLRSLKDEGTTMVLTTHYMEEAAQLCDNLVIMDKGKILKEGNPHELLRDNFERYVLETGDVQTQVQGCRMEIHNHRRYCYSDNQEQLLQIKDSITDNRVVIRNASLEDLFLKLTGRVLDE